MKNLLIFCLMCLSSPSFAQSNSNIKINANIQAGCLMSANDVHFNFDGSEVGVNSLYHPDKLKVFNNYQDLNIKVQCSKGTNIYLYSDSPQYAPSAYVYKLKHNSIANAPTPTYWFTYKSVTQGATKVTSVAYVRIHNGSIKLNFRLDTPELHTLTFSTEVDYKSIYGFVPGDYSDTIVLAFTY